MITVEIGGGKSLIISKLYLYEISNRQIYKLQLLKQ